MGLRNLSIRRASVTLPDGQTFDVRGISLFDIMAVLGDYGPQLSLVFGKLSSPSGRTRLNSDTKAVIMDLAKEFPDVLAAAISLASDDYTPEGMAIVKQLPISTQIDAVERVFELTFQSEGEVGKLVESVSRMMVAATGALTKATSARGIGGSAVN